jgi:uncharacterized protein
MQRAAADAMTTDFLDLTDVQLTRTPIFPLPGVALFPDTLLPLHIFEPRYVDMIEHAMEHGGALAIATLRPGFEADYEGRPPVDPLMGVGKILACQERDEGGLNIIVRGVTRARLRHEHTPTHSFRVGWLERVAEPPLTGHPLEDRLRGLLQQLGAQAPAAKEALDLIVGQARSPSTLTHLVAAHAVRHADLRARLFQTVDVVERLAICCEHVGRLLLEVYEAPGAVSGH